MELLEQMGHDVDTVFDEGLNSKSDRKFGKLFGRMIVSNYSRPGFLKHPPVAPGTHAGILILRLHDPGRENLFRRILAVFQGKMLNHGNDVCRDTDRKLRFSVHRLLEWLKMVILLPVRLDQGCQFFTRRVRLLQEGGFIGQAGVLDDDFQN